MCVNERGKWEEIVVYSNKLVKNCLLLNSDNKSQYNILPSTYIYLQIVYIPENYQLVQRKLESTSNIPIFEIPIVWIIPDDKTAITN